MAREMAANQVLRSLHLRLGNPPEIYQTKEVERDGEAHPALVMEYLPQTDLEAMLRKGSMTAVTQAVMKSSDMLVELHSAAPFGRRAIDPEFKEYEENKVREYLTKEAFQKFVQNKWLTETEANKLQLITEDTIQRYNAITSIPGAFTHRDTHPGNIIVESAEVTRLIDNEALMWSIKKEDGKIFGVGDPMADVGRFVSGLTLQAKFDGYHDDEVAVLTRNFIQNYQAKMGLSPLDVKTALDFYFLRFSSVILNQKHPNSANTPEIQKQIIELMKQRFLVRT